MELGEPVTDMVRNFRPLSAADVLHAWELGMPLDSLERALTLLRLSTGAPRKRLASLPIGQRDAFLLHLREITLGPRLEGSTRCPECSQQVEMSFNADDLRISDPDDAQLLTLDEEETQTHSEHSQKRGTYGSFHLVYRLPNTDDLAATLSARNVQEAQIILLRRCVIEALKEDTRLDPADLPEDVLAWLGEGIAQADPQSDILIDLTCPNCNHRWQEVFDIGTFFWAEIDSLSRRLLRDVHTLASAYGWSEASILSMSAARRQAYLEMVMG